MMMSLLACFLPVIAAPIKSGASFLPASSTLGGPSANRKRQRLPPDESLLASGTRAWDNAELVAMAWRILDQQKP